MAGITVIDNERGHAVVGPAAHFPEFSCMGFSKTTSSLTVQRHEHSEHFEICVFLRGHVTMYVGKRLFHLRGGDVLVTWPGEAHGALHDVLQPCTHFYVSFKMPRAADASGFLGLPAPESRALCRAIRGLSGNHLLGTRELEPYSKAIFQGLEAKSAIGVTQARAALQSMLVTLISLPAADAQRGVIPPGVSRARAHLETCPVPWPTIRELADIAGTSASHFCASFSKYIGVAPLKFSHHMRLRRAKELLAEPRASVTAVAVRLGYCSSQHLAACFQQYLGQTPREALRRAPARNR